MHRTSLISHKDIIALDIKLKDIVSNITKALIAHANHKVNLKNKVTIRPTEETFYTAMPAGIEELNILGNKTIQRVANTEQKDVPSVCGSMFLNDYKTGDLLAVMDATWLTSMRTGCIAALSALHYAKSDSETISVIGLGNTATAAILFIHELLPNIKKVKLLEYKDHSNRIINRFANTNLIFETYSDTEDLFKDSDIIITAMTFSEKPFVKPEWMSEGMLAIPIHMRGWQDCDALFDKIFTDDHDHTRDWLPTINGELGQVLAGHKKGRENDSEKIICYNYGIAIDDLAIAELIYKKHKQETYFTFDNYSKQYYI